MNPISALSILGEQGGTIEEMLTRLIAGDEKLRELLVRTT
jgi:hypothetical protein